MHFAVDASGLLQVTKGEAVFETMEEYTVKVCFRMQAMTAPSLGMCHSAHCWAHLWLHAPRIAW